MSWTEADIPDLTGKTAVVTGANGGLGLETARALAAKGAHVVMAARNQDKAAGAADDIRAGVPEASLELVELDLSSQSSVREAAARILERHGRIDILVNNAGVMGIPERRTEDGFEMQLATNHLGHYALTALLMPALLRATPRGWSASRAPPTTWAAPSIPATRTSRAGTARGAPTANPSSPTSTSPSGSSGCSRSRRASASSLLAHPGLSTPTCRLSACARPGAGSASGSSTASRAAPACRPRVARCPSCGRRPTPPPRAASSTGRAIVNNGPPVRKPIFRRIGIDRAIARLWEVSERETGLKLEVATPVRARLVTGATVDRAAAVRRALRALVARHGFHGASMSAVAAEAGVATGTAYTHYASKDELVLAAYLETKAELADAATAGLDPAARPAERFRHMWLAAHRHLAADRDRALFLLQVDCSPYKTDAHAAAMARGDPLRDQAAAPDIAERLLPLPLEVIYELGLGPAVRLAAAGTELGERELRATADACWRAISRPAQTRVAAHAAAAP